jgi:hypothetical protein
MDAKYIKVVDRNGNVCHLKDISAKEDLKYLEEVCNSLERRFRLSGLKAAGTSFTITGKPVTQIVSASFSFDLPEVIDYCRGKGLDEIDVSILKHLDNKLTIAEIESHVLRGRDAINKRLNKIYDIFLGNAEVQAGEKKLYRKVILKIRAHFNLR